MGERQDALVEQFEAVVKDEVVTLSENLAHQSLQVADMASKIDGMSLRMAELERESRERRAQSTSAKHETDELRESDRRRSKLWRLYDGRQRWQRRRPLHRSRWATTTVLDYDRAPGPTKVRISTGQAVHREAIGKLMVELATQAGLMDGRMPTDRRVAPWDGRRLRRRGGRKARGRARMVQRLAELWAPKGRRLVLAGVSIGGEGAGEEAAVHGPDAERLAALTAHWRPIFERRPTPEARRAQWCRQHGARARVRRTLVGGLRCLRAAVALVGPWAR